jgi:hypothetical protein
MSSKIYSIYCDEWHGDYQKASVEIRDNNTYRVRHSFSRNGGNYPRTHEHYEEGILLKHPKPDIIR